MKKSVLLIKITLPCCNDRGRSRDVQRFYLPLLLTQLEGGGRGDHDGHVLWFLSLWVVLFGVFDGGLFIRVCRWSQGVKKRLHTKGFVLNVENHSYIQRAFVLKKDSIFLGEQIDEDREECLIYYIYLCPMWIGFQYMKIWRKERWRCNFY